MSKYLICASKYAIKDHWDVIYEGDNFQKAMDQIIKFRKEGYKFISFKAREFGFNGLTEEII